MDERVPDKTSDETAVKGAVEDLLRAMGTYDIATLREMFATDANIGVVSLRNGSWITSTMRSERFLADLEAETNPTHYTEPVTEFTVYVDGSRLAFVRADAKILVNDEAVRHNFDYFTLIKIDNAWQFVNASYVSTPTPTR